MSDVDNELLHDGHPPPEDLPEGWPDSMEPPPKEDIEQIVRVAGVRVATIQFNLRELWRGWVAGGSDPEKAARRVHYIEKEFRFGDANIAWVSQLMTDAVLDDELTFHLDDLCARVARPDVLALLRVKPVQLAIRVAVKTSSDIDRFVATLGKGLQLALAITKSRGGRPRKVQSKAGIRRRFMEATERLRPFHRHVYGKRNARNSAVAVFPDLVAELEQVGLLERWLPESGAECIVRLADMADEYVSATHSTSVAPSTVRKYAYDGKEETEPRVSSEEKKAED